MFAFDLHRVCTLHLICMIFVPCLSHNHRCRDSLSNLAIKKLSRFHCAMFAVGVQPVYTLRHICTMVAPCLSQFVNIAKIH